MTPHLPGGVVRQAEIHLIRYGSETLKEMALADVGEAEPHKGGVTWIDVGGLGDVETLRALGERFQIHPLALEDVLNIGQRPKVEITSDYVFICIQMVYSTEDEELICEQVSLFLGRDFVLTVQLMDLVESLRELTTSLMELYHSSVGLRTNEIMRVLTVITSVFIPLTFVAGVYGMNFAPVDKTGRILGLNMPELYQPYGYMGVMAFMLLVAICQLVLFRKMKWL